MLSKMNAINKEMEEKQRILHEAVREKHLKEEQFKRDVIGLLEEISNKLDDLKQ